MQYVGPDLLFNYRVLLLLDGLDEVHGVGNLASISGPAANALTMAAGATDANGDVKSGPRSTTSSSANASSSSSSSNSSSSSFTCAAADAVLSPLEFAQCLLTGSLLQGCHVIVTSRPHTLSHLQSSRWFLSLPKRMVSLDIQGLSEEGVQSFIHR